MLGNYFQISKKFGNPMALNQNGGQCNLYILNAW